MKNLILSFIFLSGLFLTAEISFAHCDTQDGPVVAAANKAIGENNINYVLIWVKPDHEKELKDAFELTLNVRTLSTEAQRLADNYFFETLVRLHRSGEGIAYTGIKPKGTPIDVKILAADKAILSGDLAPLNNMVPEKNHEELRKRFEKAMTLKRFNVNDVSAGREYVDAYVQFFHLAEGEEEHAHTTDHMGHITHVPWILSAILFLTSILFGTLYFRKK